MKRVDLKTGSLCNCNCCFCAQGDNRGFGNKEASELKNSLLLAAREGYAEVIFTGGEAAIRPDIIELVKYAKDLGFQRIQMQSNGRRFSDFSFCKDIISAGANEFALSLHGPNSKIHDDLTGAPGAFRESVRGLRNLKVLGKKVLANTVITKKNYALLPQIAKLLVRLQVDQFQMAFVHVMGNARRNFESVVPRKLLVMPYVKRSLDVGINAGVWVMTEAIPYCLMSGYESYLAEDQMPDTKIFGLGHDVEDFTQARKNECKIKSKKCQECLYFDKCEGPWREYPEYFGWAEFKPVKREVS